MNRPYTVHLVVCPALGRMHCLLVTIRIDPPRQQFLIVPRWQTEVFRALHPRVTAGDLVWLEMGRAGFEGYEVVMPVTRMEIQYRDNPRDVQRWNAGTDDGMARSAHPGYTRLVVHDLVLFDNAPPGTWDVDARDWRAMW